MATARGRVAAVLASHDRFLADPGLAPHEGARAGGAVRLVEFYDYQCAPCRLADPAIRAAVRRDRGLQAVMLPLPLFGAPSVLGARAAFAASRQGRFDEVHHALMTGATPLERAALIGLARDLGLDAARFQADMDGPDFDRLLAGSRALAADFGIDGVPAYLVGDLLVRDALTPADLSRWVAAERCFARPPAAQSACVRRAGEL